MAYDQELKVGDTYPTFDYQIVTSDGNPVDLTGETVTVWLRKPKSDVFVQGSGTNNAVDESTGQYAYQWSAVDTAVGGVIALEARFTKGSAVGTAPGNREFQIMVYPHES